MVIWRKHWDTPITLRNELCSEILRRSEMEPCFATRNRGGWRSDESVFNWNLESTNVIKACALQAIKEVDALAFMKPKEYALRAWAVVNRRGSCHLGHTHADSTWSGIYYLTAGGARTFFGGDTPTAKETAVNPKPGLMVVFPSTTWHRVEAHMDDLLRITVAFDAQRKA